MNLANNKQRTHVHTRTPGTVQFAAAAIVVTRLVPGNVETDWRKFVHEKPTCLTLTSAVSILVSFSRSRIAESFLIIHAETITLRTVWQGCVPTSCGHAGVDFSVHQQQQP